MLLRCYESMQEYPSWARLLSRLCHVSHSSPAQNGDLVATQTHTHTHKAKPFGATSAHAYPVKWTSTGTLVCYSLYSAAMSQHWQILLGQGKLVTHRRVAVPCFTGKGVAPRSPTCPLCKTYSRNLLPQLIPGTHWCYSWVALLPQLTSGHQAPINAAAG